MQTFILPILFFTSTSVDPSDFIIHSSVAFHTNWRSFSPLYLLNNNTSISPNFRVCFLSDSIVYYPILNRKYNEINAQSPISCSCFVEYFSNNFMHNHSSMFTSVGSFFLTGVLYFPNLFITISIGFINFSCSVFAIQLLCLKPWIGYH